MDTSNPEPGDLGSELRMLGENLRQVFTTAWASEDRRRVQSEIEAGLNEMADALRSAADDFRQSDPGRQVEKDLQDLGQRIQSGELESQVRTDLMQVLRTVNAELDQAAEAMKRRTTTGGTGEESPK